MDLTYTASELMAAAGAREIKDREIVAVGLGLPVVASFLAKQTHAPNMTMLFELGVIDSEPVHAGVGLADPRVWYRAKVLSSFVDILGSILHKGRVDVGFLGGLETDQYGNLNTSLIGDLHGKFRHMVGSGGANDIASSAKRNILIMRHDERKLKKTISFVTSPGYMTGGDSRAKAGLSGGPSRVITDKAIFGFHPETKQMMVISIHPGNTIEDVLGTMGFTPIIPKHVPFTEPPEKDQLRLIREVIDPGKMYMG
ncbi:MAG TPA: 3-oxoadipate--succinyl-CoA transferase subunit B [Syntrophus sp. (in: bacteria)]|nr:3-oxoadipate--succinyl-CoA transferase subunit B [Syntrophus sp. (in: bacteria)]